jgi:hypothetical protein
MKRKHLIILAVVLLAAVATLSGDTIHLTNGQQLNGMYLGGTAQEVKFMGPDRQPKSYAITSIAAIEFGTPEPAPAPPPPPARSAPPAAVSATIPAGTPITVRMIDAIDSTKTAIGERFRATIDDPIVMGDHVIIQRGATCTVQIMQVQENKELAVKLYDITHGGKAYDAVSNYAQLEGQGTSKGKKAARRGAVLGGTGALIGGLAGGGRGAAIGAVAGAGVGAISGAAAKGKSLYIPPETRLMFELRAPLPLG